MVVWILLYVAVILVFFVVGTIITRSTWYRVWSCRHLGICPLCNSSPPRSICPVCQGSYEYGNDMPDDVRERWVRLYKDKRRHG